MRRFAVAMLLLAGGCAQLPADLPPRPQPLVARTSETLAGLSGEFGGRGSAVVSDAWWEDFGRPDLDRMIETALHDQPDLTIARARLEAAARIERLASLDADLRFGTDFALARHRLSENGLLPVGMVGRLYTQTEVSQTVSYDLDWWGRNSALLRAAGSERRAARNEAAAVRLDIAAAVADGYFAWAGVSARLLRARDLAANRRRQVDLLLHRHSLGLDGANPGLQARRQLDLEEDLVRQLEYQERSLRYRLSALLGQDPDHAGGLPTPSLEARLPALPTSLPLDWLARRPDIAALRERIEAASARSDAARAEFYPNLDLRLMIGLESLDLARLLKVGSVVGALGPALHLPLFETRTLQTRLGLREAEYHGAVAAYNRAILDAARQGADAYALVASLEQRSRSQRAALAEAERIRTLAEHRRALGLAGPLDTLEADNLLLGQRMSDSDTRASRLRARVALFRAIGGGANPENDR